jgi:hypothetical protein
VNVEQDKIPILLTELVERLIAARRFADGIDASVRFEKLLESRADDRVIVGDQYS